MTEELNENVRVARALDELDAEEELAFSEAGVADVGEAMDQEEIVAPAQSYAVLDLLTAGRRGVVAVTQKDIEEMPFGDILALQSIMFVLETVYDPAERLLMFMGVSPFFDEGVPEDVYAPGYTVELDRAGHKITVMRIPDAVPDTE